MLSILHVILQVPSRDNLVYNGYAGHGLVYVHYVEQPVENLHVYVHCLFSNSFFPFSYTPSTLSGRF